jgi:peptide/nickel transport system substrate-binding protein
MRRLPFWLVLISVILGSACAPSSGEGRGGPASPTRGDAPSRTKTITIGVTAPVPGLGGANIATALGGVAYTTDIHSVGLVALLTNGAKEPRLATQLPSLADGSIVLSPDGKMQTIWKLRSDALWHDGQPFTAEDLAFGAQVFLDPDMGLRTPNLAFIDGVEALDAHTIRISWSSTYYDHLALGPKELGPLPVHLLRDAYLTDKEKFHILPYWNTDYVQLGPFRLVEFGIGQQLVFEAFDRYFLGRPKVDRVVIQVVGDSGGLYAQLLAHAVDVAPSRTISDDQALQLRRDWGESGGRVLVTRDMLDYIVIQFHPERVALPELASDPRIRQGLFWGLDRETLREIVYPGFDTRAETFMGPTDPRNAAIGMPFARYRFDPAMAGRVLEDAGWRRDASGKLLRPSGEQVQLQVRGSPARSAKVAIIADMWRKLGLNIEEYLTPPALAQNREHNAMLPGVEWSARYTGEPFLNLFISRQIPIPQNNYGGANRGSYSNPRFDALVDRIYNTVNEADRTSMLKEVADIWGVDFPIFPLQYAVLFTAVAQGVFTQAPGPNDDWDFSYAHLWDRQ